MCIFRNSFILHLNVEIDQSETAFLLNISADTQKRGSRRLAIRIWDSNTRWALKWDKWDKWVKIRKSSASQIFVTVNP